VCQQAVERAVEDEELGLSSYERGEACSMMSTIAWSLLYVHCACFPFLLIIVLLPAPLSIEVAIAWSARPSMYVLMSSARACGTDKGSACKEPVSGLLDVEDAVQVWGRL
jgi:hypothetical protein